jgi:hypothetical protein
MEHKTTDTVAELKAALESFPDTAEVTLYKNQVQLRYKEPDTDKDLYKVRLFWLKEGEEL